jgi:hypothetical protein
VATINPSWNLLKYLQLCRKCQTLKVLGPEHAINYSKTPIRGFKDYPSFMGALANICILRVVLVDSKP